MTRAGLAGALAIATGLGVGLGIGLGACGDDGAGPRADAAGSDGEGSPDAPPDAARTACACTAGPPAAVGAVTGLGTSELSGLAASVALPGLFWTHADSGGPAKLFSIHADATPGGTLQLQGVSNVDWEDVAVGPCASGSCVVVSDTGDNALARTTVSIYEVAEPATEPTGVVLTASHRYDLVYPDGPHNVEALVLDPRDGASYGFTKVTTGVAALYALPRQDGSIATATKVGPFPIPVGVDRRITGASFYAGDCGVRLLVRTYDRLFELTGPAGTSMAELIATPPVAIPVATEPQGEAVAFGLDGRALYTVSEGASPTLYRSACD